MADNMPMSPFYRLSAERIRHGLPCRSDWGSIVVYLENGRLVRPKRSVLDRELIGTQLTAADIEFLRSLKLSSELGVKVEAFQCLMDALAIAEVTKPGLDPAWVNELLCFVPPYGSHNVQIGQHVQWLVRDGAEPLLALLLVMQRSNFWQRLAAHHHLDVLDLNPAHLGADPLRVPDWRHNARATFEARRAALNSPQNYAIRINMWRLSRELVGMLDVLIHAAAQAHAPLRNFLYAYKLWEERHYPAREI